MELYNYTDLVEIAQRLATLEYLLCLNNTIMEGENRSPSFI